MQMMDWIVLNELYLIRCSVLGRCLKYGVYCMNHRGCFVSTHSRTSRAISYQIPPPPLTTTTTASGTRSLCRRWWLLFWGTRIHSRECLVGRTGETLFGDPHRTPTGRSLYRSPGHRADGLYRVSRIPLDESSISSAGSPPGW